MHNVYLFISVIYVYLTLHIHMIIKYIFVTCLTDWVLAAVSKKRNASEQIKKLIIYVGTILMHKICVTPHRNVIWKKASGLHKYVLKHGNSLWRYQEIFHVNFLPNIQHNFPCNWQKSSFLHILELFALSF